MDRWAALLRPWPLLIAAIAALAAALLVDPTSAGLLSTALVALGAVCLGAFIALFAAAGRPDPPPTNATPRGVVKGPPDAST